MIVYTDGGYDKTGGYGSFCIMGPDGKAAVLVRLKLGEASTNNTAEYQTIIFALEYCKGKKIKDVKICSDSMLAIRQIQKRWKIGKPHLQKLAEKVWELSKDFDTIELEHVPRKVIVEKLGH